jgi:hypothetical protein
MIESTSSLSFRVSRYPREDICPESPLQRNGLRDYLCEQRRETALVAVLVGNDEPSSRFGELQSTAGLRERETLRFVQRCTFCTDKLTKRCATARTGELLVYTRQGFLAPSAQQCSKLLATGTACWPDELKRSLPQRTGSVLNAMDVGLDWLHPPSIAGKPYRNLPQS